MFHSFIVLPHSLTAVIPHLLNLRGHLGLRLFLRGHLPPHLLHLRLVLLPHPLALFLQHLLRDHWKLEHKQHENSKGLYSTQHPYPLTCGLYYEQVMIIICNHSDNGLYSITIISYDPSRDLPLARRVNCYC